MADFVLHSFRRCPFAIRVRMTLVEKGIPFEVKEESLKNFSPELKKMHPEAKVPLLLHGDRVVYESSIITEYIEDFYPEKSPLLPKDAGLRSEVRLWTYWCNHFFKPTVDHVKYGVSRFSEDEVLGCDDRMQTHLAKLENRLKENSWLVGDKLSLADIHVFPFVRQFSRMHEVPSYYEAYPAVHGWLEKIINRPSFEKVMAKVKKSV